MYLAWITRTDLCGPVQGKEYNSMRFQTISNTNPLIGSG